MISVLMANHNKERYVANAIESVLHQTFEQWELLIIDDYSDDNSLSIISKYLFDKRIKLFKNLVNIGKTQVLKKIIARTAGEIIVEVDSDDFINKEALTLIFQAYADYPNCGMVYTQCWYCDENLMPIHLGYSAAIPPGKSNLHVNSVVAMRTFRKSDYLKTAGYDETILYAEDLDLTLKLEEVTKLYFLDKPLYYYRILPKSQTHSFKNTRINRSSSALAKLNAYERRLDSAIPNLDKKEMCEVLFWGTINSILAIRFKLAIKFIFKLFAISPMVFFQADFYKLIYLKIKKIIKLKKEKPLLKI